MRKLLAILVILVTFSASQARADEGMWLLPLIEKLNIGTMTEIGAQADSGRYLQHQPGEPERRHRHLRRRLYG